MVPAATEATAPGAGPAAASECGACLADGPAGGSQRHAVVYSQNECIWRGSLVARGRGGGWHEGQFRPMVQTREEGRGRGRGRRGRSECDRSGWLIRSGERSK